MDAGLKSVRAQAIYGLMCWAGGAKVPREGLEGWGSRRGVKAGFNSGFARANHVARLRYDVAETSSRALANHASAFGRAV